jgi:PAS domain S-box-containing protein
MAEDEAKYLQVPRLDAPTETIDLDNLFSQQLTASGSFDLRGIHATSLGKLLQALPMPALLVDRDNQIVFANSFWGQLSTDPGRTSTRTLVSLFPQQDQAEKAQSLFDSCLVERKPQISEVVVNVGRRKIWGRMHLRAIRIGSERYLLALIEDLTLEKQQLLLTKKYSDELRKAHDELERRVQDRTAELSQANQQLQKEILEKQLAEEKLRKARDQLELRVDQRTSELKTVNEQLSQEIDERRQIEDALRRANELQEQLLAVAATAIFTVDEKGLVTSVNNEFSGMTGFDAKDIVGRSCSIFCTQGNTAPCSLFDMAPDSRMFRNHANIITKDGRTISVLRNAAMMRDGSGFVTGGIESFVDVTELTQARRSAEQANRAKSQFLARMSHEIRTPMNGVIGMTELALSTNLTPEQRDYLETVQISADSLLSLINDILDFSKIEAGKLELHPQPFDLRACLESIMTAMAVQAHSKGLELAYLVAPEVPDVLIGDAARLRQILVNLVGNSIKFTERGEILVELRGELHPRDTVVLHVTVSDTGVGVPNGMERKIFDAFEQADGSAASRVGGAGLGLAICSQLVKLMGGKIWVDSEPGQGSKFHFDVILPVGKDILAVRPSSAPAELKGIRALVVDDNAANRKILAETLAQWDMKTEAVESGSAALEAIDRASVEGDPFRLTLIDFVMPHMNGLELADKIRAKPGGDNLGVIMLTSAYPSDETTRPGDALIDAYLPKPVRQSTLMSEVARLLGSGGAAEGPSSAASETPRPLRSRSPRRILLAEDNAVNRKLSSSLLDKMGHKTYCVENGKEVLDALAKDSFDLILMDVQMPEMDGIEATRAIRAMEQTTGERIPIIAMTAYAMTGDRQRCLDAGMDGYVSKPIDKRRLFEAIEELPQSAQPSQRPPSVAFDAGGAVDKTRLDYTLQGDMDLLEELAGLFFLESPRLAAKMRQAIDLQDAKALQHLAHSLRGSVGNFAADPAFNAALRLELIAGAGDLSQAWQAFEDLERELARLSQELQAIIAAGQAKGRP